jgi:hypothetical protein
MNVYVWCAGDHNIEVMFHNIAVNGSPFISKICDATQIIVTNINGTAVAGKSFEFDSKCIEFLCKLLV